MHLDRIGPPHFFALLLILALAVIWNLSEHDAPRARFKKVPSVRGAAEEEVTRVGFLPLAISSAAIKTATLR
jgi:hypothetical protein